MANYKVKLRGHIYEAGSSDDILEQIKDKSPNTRDMDIKDYIDTIVQPTLSSTSIGRKKIESLGEGKNLSPDAILDAWKKLGIVEVMSGAKESSYQR